MLNCWGNGKAHLSLSLRSLDFAWPMDVPRSAKAFRILYLFPGRRRWAAHLNISEDKQSKRRKEWGTYQAERRIFIENNAASPKRNDCSTPRALPVSPAAARAPGVLQRETTWPRASWSGLRWAPPPQARQNIWERVCWKCSILGLLAYLLARISAAGKTRGSEAANNGDRPSWVKKQQRSCWNSRFGREVDSGLAPRAASWTPGSSTWSRCRHALKTTLTIRSYCRHYVMLLSSINYNEYMECSSPLAFWAYI